MKKVISLSIMLAFVLMMKAQEKVYQPGSHWTAVLCRHGSVMPSSGYLSIGDCTLCLHGRRKARMPNGTSIGQTRRISLETGILRGMRYMNITKKCMERRAMPILQPCSKPWTTTLYNGRNCLRKQEPSMWCLPQSITTAMHCGQARRLHEISDGLGTVWISVPEETLWESLRKLSAARD